MSKDADLQAFVAFFVRVLIVEIPVHLPSTASRAQVTSMILTGASINCTAAHGQQCVTVSQSESESSHTNTSELDPLPASAP